MELPDELCDALPRSEVWLRARFTGLLGDVRGREDALTGTALGRVDERRASFDGGNGTASGDGVCGGLLAVKRVGLEIVRFGEDEGVGDLLGDFRFHFVELAR